MFHGFLKENLVGGETRLWNLSKITCNQSFWGTRPALTLAVGAGTK